MRAAVSAENTPLQGRALENLVAFARLLGYVRYFHPSDEAVTLDWDRYAVVGVLTVESAQTPEELANRLEKLFRPYAPTIRVFPTGNRCHRQEVNRSIPTVQKLYTARWRHHGYGFLDNPDDWMQDWFYSERIYEAILSAEIATGDFSAELPLLKELGGGVSACIPAGLYATLDSALPKSTPSVSNPYLFEGEPVTLTGEDRATRLADVILAWNIFQHFYQYFDAVEVDWSEALEIALIEAAVDANTCEFKDTLQKMIAQLEDGHGYVFTKDETCFRSRAVPRLLWDWIENRLVVTDAMRVQGAEKLEAGDIVLAIDGAPVELAISEREKYAPGATVERRRYLALQELLQGEWGSIVRLKIQKPNGRIIHVQRFRDVAIWDEFRYPNVEELEPGIFYLNLDKLTQDEFTAMLPQLVRAKGIIFDMRGYPRDILITSLGHMTNESLTSPQWGFPIILYPDHENMTFEFDSWVLEPSAPYLTAKKVFITDERAISLAETWLSLVSAHHIAEIVGEPSAGENCNAIFEWLPGDYRITWTGCKVLNQDGSQFHGIGIQPTVPAHRTIQGVIERRDELLEKALEIVR